MGKAREDVEGVMHPESFYTTEGVNKALGISTHQVYHWIKTRRVEPINCSRGYGFFGRQILAALVADNEESRRTKQERPAL